jgi:origin recognition complex subunit 2
LEYCQPLTVLFVDDIDALEESTPTKSRTKRQSGRQHLPRQISDLSDDEGFPDVRNDEEDADADAEVGTPSKRNRGRTKGNTNKARIEGKVSTPRKLSNGENNFSTPTGRGGLHQNVSRLALPDADQSARRKSARRIIERTITNDVSEDDEDEDLARQIYDSEEQEEAGETQDAGSEDLQEVESAPTTPSKRPRGRPKGAKNKRSPTPPRDLPPHELYFAQNRGGGMKTSNNNLSSLALLDHEEYFTLVRDYKDPHADDILFLQELHSRSFNQWQFELSQDFNICIYGFGSKRKLLTTFAEHIYKSQTDHQSNKVVIVNGYVHNTTIRDILNTLATAIEGQPPKLGSQVTDMLDTFCSLLETDKTKHITLLINSIDAPPLRRPTTQTLLARLASHPQISLIASADHPNFPLLWDSSLRSTYNFLFHDCTTFQPYVAEIDVVNEVHELLGRSGRRVGGKEGVSFVLKSLNQNSRKLFQLLVAEQLAGMDEVGGGLGGEEEGLDDGDGSNDDERHANGDRRSEQGVEYRLLYQKAVEDFICGDEVSFRTLLKEYVIRSLVFGLRRSLTPYVQVPRPSNDT